MMTEKEKYAEIAALAGRAETLCGKIEWMKAFAESNLPESRDYTEQIKQAEAGIETIRFRIKMIMIEGAGYMKLTPDNA